MDEQGPGGGVAPQREHEPDERHDVPDGPLGEPRPQPEAAEEGGRRDEREDPDVARHLGQVVVREEGGLAQRARPAQQVRHQHQQQPPVRERARVEQGHRARAALGRADDGQARQPLHGPEADAEHQAGGHRARRPGGGRPAGAASEAGDPPGRVDDDDHAGVGYGARLAGQDREAERPGQDRDPAEPGCGAPGLGEPEHAEQLHRHPAHAGHQPEVSYLGRHGAGEGERDRPEQARQAAQAQGPQEEERAKPRHRPGGDHVERPGGGAGQDREQERERVRGGRVPAGEQRRAAPDVRVIQRQLAAADLVPGQDAQREVLRQVVAGENRVPEQRRDSEDDHRQRDEDDDGQQIAAAVPGRGRAGHMDGRASRCQ